MENSKRILSGKSQPESEEVILQKLPFRIIEVTSKIKYYNNSRRRTKLSCYRTTKPHSFFSGMAIIQVSRLSARNSIRISFCCKNLSNSVFISSI